MLIQVDVDIFQNQFGSAGVSLCFFLFIFIEHDKNGRTSFPYGSPLEKIKHHTEEVPQRTPESPLVKTVHELLTEDEAWKPGITIKQILLGVQDLLDSPNPLSPAQEDAYRIFTTVIDS